MSTFFTVVLALVNCFGWLAVAIYCWEHGPGPLAGLAMIALTANVIDSVEELHKDF